MCWALAWVIGNEQSNHQRVSYVHGALSLQAFTMNFQHITRSFLPKLFYIRQRLTRVEETIPGPAGGHRGAAPVGAVEGRALGGATVSVAREESFKGGEVGGGTATGRRRRQARKQRA